MSTRQVLVGLTVLAALAVAAYSNTFDVPFQFDGKIAIVNNRNIHVEELAASKLWTAATRMENWADPSTRPATNLTFALNHYLGGLDPLGYHVVSLLIHILGGVAVFFLIFETLGLIGQGSASGPARDGGKEHSITSPWTGRFLIALLSSLLWLVHPIQTSAVPYIYQRYVCMGGMLYLWSLVCYLEARKAQMARKRPRAVGGWYAAAVALYLLALGSKENSAALPVILLLYELLIFSKLDWKRTRSLMIWGALFLLPSLVVGIIYLGYKELAVGLFDLGATRGDHFSRVERILTQPRAILFHLTQLLLPHPSRLNVDHDFTISHSLFDPPVTAVCLILLLAAAVCAILYRRRWPLVALCILWFLANLAMESSIVLLEIAHEYRLYLPSVGMALLLAGFLSWRGRCRDGPVWKGIVAILVVVFSIWTFQRNEVWGTEESLWRDAALKSPNKPRPQINLGLALADQGKRDEALEHFERAVKLEPRFAWAQNSLGAALAARGELDRAAFHLAEAVRLHPRFARAHNNLGSVLVRQGKPREAIVHFRAALTGRPDSAEAHNNLGNALADLGKLDEAIRHHRRAVQINPGYADGHSSLGIDLAQKGNLKEAIHHFAEALRIQPDHLHANFNLGKAYLQAGDREGALRQYEILKKLNANLANQLYRHIPK